MLVQKLEEKHNNMDQGRAIGGGREIGQRDIAESIYSMDTFGVQRDFEVCSLN